MKENPNDILLTEDGQPIGQLVIAETSVPACPEGFKESEARRELLAESARELTGDLDADTAVAELYPGFGDPDARKRAGKLFVIDKLSVDEVAEKVGVPPRTVSMWAYLHKWDELLKKEIAVRQAQSILDLARIRSENRTRLVREQLAQAKLIRDRAAENIKSDRGGIKSNADAWAAAARIEHTLTGVSEAGTVAGIDDEQSRKDEDDRRGKTPLVMVFQGGGGLPPQIRRPV